MAELKACGHCGGEALSCEWATFNPIRFYVECQTCGVKTKGHKTAAGAEDDWNRRAVDPLMKELAEALRHASPRNGFGCGDCFRIPVGEGCHDCELESADERDAALAHYRAAVKE